MKEARERLGMPETQCNVYLSVSVPVPVPVPVSVSVSLDCGSPILRTGLESVGATAIETSRTS
jgi:hypothetical protein